MSGRERRRERRRNKRLERRETCRIVSAVAPYYPFIRWDTANRRFDFDFEPLYDIAIHLQGRLLVGVSDLVARVADVMQVPSSYLTT